MSSLTERLGMYGIAIGLGAIAATSEHILQLPNGGVLVPTILLVSALAIFDLRYGVGPDW